MEGKTIMNKKHFVLPLLLLLGSNIHTVPQMGVEFTWPLSALLMVGQGSDFTTTISVLVANNEIIDGATPQVNGYYATSYPFCIALQKGIWETWISQGNYAFWFNRDNPYTSPTLYYSDIVRAMRSPEVAALIKAKWGFYNDSVNCKTTSCKVGPSNALERGFTHSSCPPPAGTCSFDRAAALIIKSNAMPWYNGNSGALTTPSWLNFDANSFYPEPIFNDEAKGFYFAETNTQYVYLPLHMISPGENLLAADPDFVNFGPLPPGKHPAPQLGTWLPWTSGYAPINVPYDALKSVIPGINANSQVDF
jgi:hypothetical protein